MPRTAALSALLFLAGICLSRNAQATTIASQTETTPYPGVRILTIRTASPATRAWAAVVDLCGAYVHVDATKASTSTRTTGAWASALGAQLATNGDFFKTGPLRVYGNAVGSGTPWPVSQTGTDPQYSSEWSYDHYGWIAFGPDWVDFTHTEYVKNHPAAYPFQEGWRPSEVNPPAPPGTLALVSGFPELVVEGNIVTCSSPTATTCFPDRSDMRARHPRTAMGITEDRRTFILLVVDGRTSLSAGMYGTELAWLMGKLGAWQAFNLDGGGSSQFWQDGKGYLNDVTGNNNGAGTRAVANHWGVFAGTASKKAKRPGHCVDYLVESILNQGTHAASAMTDIDGDGTADACIRGRDGIHCVGGASGALGPDQTFTDLGDAHGWADLSNYGALRMGDVDGDRRADLCGRANASVQCWLSTPTPFATPISGPALSDGTGWNEAAYFSSLQLADFNGDGRDDLCARAPAGLTCYPSLGTGFGSAVVSTRFADGDGFSDPNHGASLRMGDLDGDGKADACARGAEGVRCYLSDGQGFPTEVVGPSWTDANGWASVRYWSTVQLVDVDGDHKADLCARTANDFRCHLSTGTGFGPAVVKAIMTNAEGWDQPSRYSTIRMADVDGDGDADLCGRDGIRWVCWLWEGSGFGDSFDGPELPDNEGWAVDRLYAGIRMADVTGDGKADVCMRDASGLACWVSNGKGFPTRLGGPGWAGLGWEHPSVFGTLMISGVRRSDEQDGGTEGGPGADGSVDASAQADTGAYTDAREELTAVDGEEASGQDGSQDGSGAAGGGADAQAGTCACRQGRGRRASGTCSAVGALVVGLAVRRRGRTRRMGGWVRTTRPSKGVPTIADSFR